MTATGYALTIPKLTLEFIRLDDEAVMYAITAGEKVFHAAGA